MFTAIKRMMGRIAAKVMSLFTRPQPTIRSLARSAWQVLYSAAAIFAAGYVLSSFMASYFVAAIMSTIVVHGFAHWITALRTGREVDVPLYIPAIFGIGHGSRMTHFGIDPETDMKIYMSGPSWGFLWAIMGAGVAVYYSYTHLVAPFVALAAFNVWQGTYGSDGRLYAALKAKLEEEHDSPYRTVHMGPDVVYGPVEDLV